MSFRLAYLAPIALLALVGCNTVEGMGQDMQSGGQAVEDTAEDAKE